MVFRYAVLIPMIFWPNLELSVLSFFLNGCWPFASIRSVGVKRYGNRQKIWSLSL